MFAVLLLLPTCAKRMTLDEAKQVTVLLMQAESFVPPPRRINDILDILNQANQRESDTLEWLKGQVSEPPPPSADDWTLGNFYYHRGQAAFLLSSGKQALDDYRAAYEYGVRNPQLLRRLGMMERDFGNFKKGIDLVRDSLRAKEDSATYSVLLGMYLRVGDFGSASKTKALGIAHCNKILRRDPLAVWANYQLAAMEGAFLEAQGQFAEAEKYRRRQLDLMRSITDKEPMREIWERDRLAENLLRQGRLVEAESEARHAVREALGLTGQESTAVAITLHKLAKVLVSQGRLEEGEKLAVASINMMERDGVSSASRVIGSTRMFLGKILNGKHDFFGAMGQFDLVRESMRENEYLYNTNFTQNRDFMLALLKTGRLDEAMTFIKGAHDKNRKRLSHKNSETAELQGLLGIAHLAKGEEQEAARELSSATALLLERGLENIQDEAKRERVVAILESYIDLLARAQKTPPGKRPGMEPALEALKVADALSARSISTAIGESSARAAAAFDPELADLARKEQDIRKEIRVLETTLSELMAAPADDEVTRGVEQLKTNIRILTEARDTILGEINKRFPKYGSFVNPRGETGAVQQSLRHGETLISIYTADDKTYVWAIPEDGEIKFHVAPMGKKEMASVVADLRQSLDSRPNTLGDIPEFDVVQAYRLYSTLLQPVDAGWKNASDLMIVAPGPLGQLPLSILPTEPVTLAPEKAELFSKYRDVPWLIRKVSVTMLPSVSTLVSLRMLALGDPKRKAFAGFGDAIFSPVQLVEMTASKREAREEGSNIELASRGMKVQVRGVRVAENGSLDSKQLAACHLGDLQRLPDTAEEITSIAVATGADLERDVFLGENASEDQVKTMNLSDRRIISFATHALLPWDLDGLDQPALALSSPAITGENEDGLLTMGEIMKLKLNADWVVLSACNTGAAEGAGAEAVSGLGRAFFYAGARALLVSMWSVETTSAKNLVTGIFQSHRDDQMLSRAQALRKSALELIDRGNLTDRVTGKIAASYAHPFFWAPFVIVGDPGTRAP